MIIQRPANTLSTEEVLFYDVFLRSHEFFGVKFLFSKCNRIPFLSFDYLDIIYCPQFVFHYHLYYWLAATRETLNIIFPSKCLASIVFRLTRYGIAPIVVWREAHFFRPINGV